MRFIIPLLIFILISSCKKEVRVDLLSENGKEVFFNLEKDEIVNLYTEINITYKEKPLFVYHCSFKQDDLLMFEGGTDPLITIENEKEELKVIDGITHWKFFGKLDGNLTAKKDGVYSIKTTFLKNKQQDLKISKAEIVFTR